MLVDLRMCLRKQPQNTSKLQVNSNFCRNTLVTYGGDDDVLFSFVGTFFMHLIGWPTYTNEIRGDLLFVPSIFFRMRKSVAEGPFINWGHFSAPLGKKTRPQTLSGFFGCGFPTVWNKMIAMNSASLIDTKRTINQTSTQSMTNDEMQTRFLSSSLRPVDQFFVQLNYNRLFWTKCQLLHWFYSPLLTWLEGLVLPKENIRFTSSFRDQTLARTLRRFFFFIDCVFG